MRCCLKIALVLLTRNERPCLEVMLPKLPAPGIESGFDSIYAVDGNSTDGTVELLEKKNIPVLRQQRKGRGDAFQVAFSQIPADAWIFFSPDGNEDPRDLPKFRPLLEKGADLVIASRMMNGAVNEEDHQLLKWRKWANNGFNLMANGLFRKQGPYVTDSINGYRAIRKEAIEKLDLDALGYTIEFQMTIRALHRGLNIHEFPTHEGQRVAGDTGAPSIPTGLAFLKCLKQEWIGKNRRSSRTPPKDGMEMRS